MAGQKDMDCSNTTQCVCFMARTKRKNGTTTPRNTSTDSTRSYEYTKIGYPNNKKKETKGEEKTECILAKENDSLKKLVPGILHSRERQVGVYLVTFDELKGYITTNLCGVYPTMSNCGMKYILVLYDYNSDAILARTMKTNKRKVITTAYKSIYDELTEAGITPILQYLDNETLKELIAAIETKT